MNTCRVLHVNSTDIVGGAARAAYRIHCALLKNGLNSCMCVDSAVLDDYHIIKVSSNFSKYFRHSRLKFANLFFRFFKTDNSILHSPALLSSGYTKLFKMLSPGIIHLHWICGEMLSIAEIGRLQGSVVWTLHDMWPFCGAEHYTDDFRWRDGYSRTNRPVHESGFDLNRWVWERKRKHWKRPFHIVTPSRWLGRCVKESELMREWPVTVIPNALDTDSWAPFDQRIARSLLGLPQDEPLVLFGAMGGGRQSIKGFDLLFSTLQLLADDSQNFHLVIFGETAPREPLLVPFEIHYMGHLYDDVSLRLLYSAADVMVIPSRLDNLPNTGVEAIACGTPVVAFDICGLPDIVEHQVTGYLAKAFETEDLAVGIEWVLADYDRLLALRRSARKFAVEHFCYPRIAAMYESVYEQQKNI